VSLNYLVGRSVRRSIEWVARRPGLARRLRLPRGLCWPYDAARSLGGPVRRVVDAGANVGQTALYLVKFFPRAEIHAFEPAGGTFEILRAATRSRPAIRCHRLALGAHVQEARLLVRADHETNRLLDVDPAFPGEATEPVVVTTLDAFALDAGIDRLDVLKMDVQGHELRLLDGGRDLLASGRVGCIYTEVAFRRGESEMQNFDELNDRLQGHGFLLGGFYEPFRWGPVKDYLGFCNALYLNPAYRARA
jgi:FkbM family methyltransferase